MKRSIKTQNQKGENITANNATPIAIVAVSILGFVAFVLIAIGLMTGILGSMRH